MKEEDIAMQVYCVHCGEEQYAPNVWGVSHGEKPCCWCGKMSKRMTEKEYKEKHIKFH
jgi:hypothetical protein